MGELAWRSHDLHFEIPCREIPALADFSMRSCGRESLEECHSLVTISVNVECMQRRAIEEYLQEQDPEIPKEMMDKMRAILEGQARADRERSSR